jgi:hypothetical protein
MKIVFFVIAAGFMCLLSFSQNIDKIINAEEVERIEKILSADDMMGRKTFTPGIDKAADFIATEFAKSKLKYLGNATNYFQDIVMIKAKPLEINGMLEMDSLNAKNVAANTTAAEININSLKDYEIKVVQAGEDFNKTVFPLFDLEKNIIVLVDTAHARRFKSMQRFAGNAKFSSAVSQIFI